jgi:hypothetical protein
MYDNYDEKKTPYKLGVIEKENGVYDLNIAKKPNDIFRTAKQSKDKKELEVYAKKHNIKIYTDYKEVHNLKKSEDEFTDDSDIDNYRQTSSALRNEREYSRNNY